jgi:hypothetical protein
MARLMLKLAYPADEIKRIFRIALPGSHLDYHYGHIPRTAPSASPREASAGMEAAMPALSRMESGFLISHGATAASGAIDRGFAMGLLLIGLQYLHEGRQAE